MRYFLAALLLCVIAAFLFLRVSYLRKRYGIPAGKVVYTDTGAEEQVSQPFFDPRLNLTGKPDYVIKQGHTLIPVEVKTGSTPLEPYDSHIFQLAAYCILIDRATGLRPPYGILKYPKQSFFIDFTETLETQLLELMDKIRDKERNSQNVPRSHNEPQRCRRCGYRKICDQRIL
jgi:CRISPR-associated exonuclease Cas4